MNEHPLNALPQGYRLQEYEMVRVLGLGGFGVTYLGYDHNLDKPVAVKEYLPTDIAVRTENQSIAPKASTFREDFAWGLDRFLDEARTLARFDHRNIVKVYRYFEANGTAYIVMEYAEGETLSTFLSRKGPLDESEVKAILIPILDGLETVHAADFLHRDIKPANIVLRDEDASPVLVDFGAARQAISGRSQSVTTIITPGYAPIEQYSSRGNQGPWTDIYALGAVCYKALTGKAPVDSIERLTDDQLEPVSSNCIEKGSEGFLKAIDWALHVKEADRPHNKSEWYLALTAPEPISADVPTSEAVGSLPENLPAHDYRGFDRAGIHRDTGTQYDQHGLDQRGFDANGFDSEGYDRYGYGKDGFDRDGYREVKHPNYTFLNREDKEGYDKEGFHLESKLHKITGTEFDLDGYEWHGYDREGYRRSGFNANKVDRLGYKEEISSSDARRRLCDNGSEIYDSNGFDKKGFDKKGFNRAGIHKATKSELDTYGYNRSGYDRNGFNRAGIHQATGTKYDNGGYDKDGRDENGHRFYDIHGFHLSSKEHRQTSVEYDIEGYDADGYDNKGLSRTGFKKDGTWHYKPGNLYIDSRGFNKETGDHWATGTSRDPEGFDRWGKDDSSISYDRSGFGYYSGYNREGFHRDTGTKFNPAGFDRDGYNKDGYNSHKSYGCDRAGYNRAGFHEKTNLHRETGTLFDPQGYDSNGFDLDGYDREGLDSSGIDKNGYANTKFGRFHHETHINKDTGTEFNPQGFSWKGTHQTGKWNDPQGFDALGFRYVKPLFHGDDCPTKYFNRRYLDRNGYDIDGYNREGYNWNGYDHRGFYYKGYHRDTKSIFDNDGYDRDGFNEAGYNRDGFERDGYHKATGTTACPEGFDAEGFHFVSGFHKKTKRHRMTGSEYDTKGYNVEGYDRACFDRFGFDENDFDIEGFHSSGYDNDMYDRDGYDRSGYDRNGIHRDTGTELDLRGFIYFSKYDIPMIHQKTNKRFDPDGYNSFGWDRYGFDRDGFHIYTLARFNPAGIDNKGLNQFGKRRSITKKVLEVLFRIDDWPNLAILTVMIALAGLGIIALLIQVTEPTVNETSNIIAEAGRKASSGESSTLEAVVDYLPGFLVNYWRSMPDLSQPEHVLESVLLFFVFVLFYLLRIVACFMALVMNFITIRYFKTEERYYLDKEERAVDFWIMLVATLAASLGAFGIYRLFITT